MINFDIFNLYSLCIVIIQKSTLKRSEQIQLFIGYTVVRYNNFFHLKTKAIFK
ncbi:hypothetical protein CDOMC_0956 [Campylobacter sp. RM16192]|nr:hypothetical protein CDOMC_0956 [Campylobacter sp. RM16192]